MRKKKILAVSIITIGVITSAYLVFYNSDVDASSVSITGSERVSAQFPDTTANTNIDIANPAYNITDEAAKDYTKKIVQMNNGGQGNTTNVVLPNADDFESIVKGYISQDIQFKEYTEKDIRLSQNNSTQAKIIYLQEIQKIQNKLISPLKTSFVYAAAFFINDKQSNEIQKHINISQEYIAEILAIVVPKNAKQFHLDLLNIYEKRKTLGTILLENPDDPLKSIIVLKEIEKLTEKEATLANSFELILKQ